MCEAEEPTEDQKKKITEKERLDKLRSGGKCADKNIVIEIDGIKLFVPRYNDVNFDDGSKIGRHELQYRCDLHHLRDVANVLIFPSLGISKNEEYEAIYKKIIFDHSKRQLVSGYILEILDESGE